MYLTDADENRLFELTGEYRLPYEGEWVVSVDSGGNYYAAKAKHPHLNKRRVILTDAIPRQDVIGRVRAWCHDKLGDEGFHAQVSQMVEELGELCDARKKGRADDVPMEAGDVGVVWIAICHTLGLHPMHCLERAYRKIRDREGRMVDGQFVKEEDVA